MKPRLFARVPLFLALYFLTSAAHATPLTEAIDAARAQVRENILPKTPGVSIAVAHDGTILWSEGFGFADLAAHKPVTTQTQFRIGSVAKPLTAAGLMLLVEQNKVDLDADIHRYVPDFPDKGVTITTRQLAGHLGGIRHYRGEEFYSDVHYDSVRASLKIFENDPLLFPPGKKYSYSSYGYNLISMVMESAAHENFLQYMQRAVFAPLGMTNTVPDDTRRELPNRACCYEPGSGSTQFTPAPAVDNSYKWASGGFLSTPEDLVRFASALLHPSFLKSDSLRAMFASQKTSDGKATGYGIGWSVRRDERGHPVWSHSGGAVGGVSELVIHPETGVIIAITCNFSNPSGASLPFDKRTLQLITDDFTSLFPN